MSTLLKIDIAEFQRRGAAGVYGESERLELVRGEVREMSPIGNPHAEVLTKLMDWAYEHRTARGFRIRCQSPIGMAITDSFLQPDMVLTLARSYWTDCPTSNEAILVVEVADTSFAFDLGEKAHLYAEGGVREYWVVDILRQEIVVHRDPSAEGYKSIARFARGQSVAPLAFPEMGLDIELLFT